MSDGTFNGSLQFAALRAEAEGFLHTAAAFRALMSAAVKRSALLPAGDEETLAQAELTQSSEDFDASAARRMILHLHQKSATVDAGAVGGSLVEDRLERIVHRKGLGSGPSSGGLCQATAHERD